MIWNYSYIILIEHLSGGFLKEKYCISIIWCSSWFVLEHGCQLDEPCAFSGDHWQMQQCFTDIYKVFRVLFHCFILLEMKLTTTWSALSKHTPWYIRWREIIYFLQLMALTSTGRPGVNVPLPVEGVARRVPGHAYLHNMAAWNVKGNPRRHGTAMKIHARVIIYSAVPL